MSGPGQVLALYNKLSKYPFGKQLFSLSFGVFAPYFLTINASVEELKPGYAVTSLKQRWLLQNHIKSVHAIALCNLAEMNMGIVAEASIPKHLRWIPLGMEVEYKKKALGKITATTKIDHETFFNLPTYPGPVVVPISMTNEANEEVCKANIKLWISERPQKK